MLGSLLQGTITLSMIMVGAAWAATPSGQDSAPAPAPRTLTAFERLAGWEYRSPPPQGAEAAVTRLSTLRGEQLGLAVHTTHLELDFDLFLDASGAVQLEQDAQPWAPWPSAPRSSPTPSFTD